MIELIETEIKKIEVIFTDYGHQINVENPEEVINSF